MSRFTYLFALVLLAGGMSACSSQPADRSTASSDDVKVYKPAVGETRHFD